MSATILVTEEFIGHLEEYRDGAMQNMLGGVAILPSVHDLFRTGRSEFFFAYHKPDSPVFSDPS